MSATDNKIEGSPDFDASKPSDVMGEGVWLTQLAALRKLSQIANDAPTFDLALSRGLEIVAETLEVEQAVLLLYDAQSHSLIPHSFVNGYTGSYTSSFAKIDLKDPISTLSIEVFKMGLPSYCNDCASNTRCDEVNGRILNIRNQLAVPIRSERHTRGVCLVINKRKGDFSRVDLELFETLAIPLANLLKNIGLVKKLEDQQRRHLAVLDAAVDGFIEVDRDFKITLFNKGAENLTGWTAENALGRTCSEVLMPHDPDGTSLCLTCPLNRAFRSGQSVSNIETLIQTHDGEDNWTACSYNSVTNERGDVVSGVIAIKDIYRLKALGDELQLQIQQQQSLLGVINAINGFNNIEEIYHRALNEVRKAIHFDIGTIHAIDEDGKSLRLISQYQVIEGQIIKDGTPVNPVGDADARTSLLNTLNEELEGTVTRQLDEYWEFEQAARSRNSESTYHPHRTPASSTSSDASTTSLKLVESCDALCQNEPYMAVNLPGKPVCPVLSDFSNLQSHICVPIKTQEHTYGVLHLASFRPYAFWGSDFSLAYNICKQIAVAAERASLFERIDTMARTDLLTNLFNHYEFWERLDIEVRSAERHNMSLTLMVLDLDRLKWFNDYYGHHYGDILLKQISQVIRQKSRASDIAFRFGGDELCLLLPNTNLEEARVVAERIRKAAAEVSVFPNQDVIGAEGLVTMSIGVATFPYDAQTSLDLFLSADAAQHRAKNTGKNKVCLFDPAVDFKDVTLQRRNPSDFDRRDPRLTLPSINPDDVNLPTNHPLTTKLSVPERATLQTEEQSRSKDEPSSYESHYDIEVLPDPADLPNHTEDQK